MPLISRIGISDGFIKTNSPFTPVIPDPTGFVVENLITRYEVGELESFVGVGTVISDTTVNNNDAQIYNGYLFTFDDGGAVLLDGINRYIETPDSSLIRATVGNALTVQVWMKVESTYSDGDGLFSKQYGSSQGFDGYSLLLKNNNSIGLYMNGDSIDGQYVSTSDNVWTPDFWHLFTAVIRFGGGSANPSKVYVDTTEITLSSGGENNETSIPNNNAPFRIASGIQDVSPQYTPCKFAAMYVYDRALSSVDVFRNYEATKSRYGY